MHALVGGLRCFILHVCIVFNSFSYLDEEEITFAMDTCDMGLGDSFIQKVRTEPWLINDRTAHFVFKM